MSKSKIEWTDATWNPARGCSRVSEGCRNCYAERMAARFSEPGLWGHGFAEMRERHERDAIVSVPRWTGHVELVESNLGIPLRWRKPRRVFVNSTSDLFHEKLSDEDIDRVFAVMARCPQHTFQVLTKRPERMRRWFAGQHLADPPLNVHRSTTPWAPQIHAGDPCCFPAIVTDQPARQSRELTPWPLPNVWLGTSVEDQASANERIPHLLETPAAVRFVSCEPLLGSTSFNLETDVCTIPSHPTGIDWVIAGGESGPGARPCHVEWIRSIVKECRDEGVAVFVKQLGAHPKVTIDGMPLDVPLGRAAKGGRWEEWPAYLDDLKVREFPPEHHAETRRGRT